MQLNCGRAEVVVRGYQISVNKLRWGDVGLLQGVHMWRQNAGLSLSGRLITHELLAGTKQTVVQWKHCRWVRNNKTWAACFCHYRNSKELHNSMLCSWLWFLPPWLLQLLICVKPNTFLICISLSATQLPRFRSKRADQICRSQLPCGYRQYVVWDLNCHSNAIYGRFLSCLLEMCFTHIWLTTQRKRNRSKSKVERTVAAHDEPTKRCQRSTNNDLLWLSS